MASIPDAVLGLGGFIERRRENTIWCLGFGTAKERKIKEGQGSSKQIFNKYEAARAVKGLPEKRGKKVIKQLEVQWK